MYNYNYEIQGAGNWLARRAEDNYQDTRKFYNAEVMAAIHGNAQLDLERQKAELRKKEEEVKRGIYEAVVVDEKGRPYLETRNLWIDAKPREFINLCYPKLTRVARASCLEEYVFIISGKVNETPCLIYLDPKKAGSGTYLLGKLTAAGICIYAPERKAKQYARLMLGWLLGNAENSVIADEPGWTEINGEVLFIPEGRMTWQEIKKLL